MKKSLVLVSVLGLLAAGQVGAQGGGIDLGGDPALTIAGRDLAPGDPRVAKARDWLKRVAEATGETEEQVAAASMKLARFFFDSLHERALPIETLEGMAVQATPGKALSDLTSGYFQARRASPDKGHAGAMAGLAKAK